MRAGLVADSFVLGRVEDDGMMGERRLAQGSLASKSNKACACQV